MPFNPLKIFKNKSETKTAVESPSLPLEKHISEETKTTLLPSRDAHGRFISKKTAPSISKKTVEEIKKEPTKPQETKVESDIKGPFVANYYGVQIRKYHDGEKWYFSIQDFLPLGEADPPRKNLEILKQDETFKEIFMKVVKIIDEIPCADSKGTVEILKAVGAVFPGPTFRWVEETASFPFI
jgi:hypothetical protein